MLILFLFCISPNSTNSQLLYLFSYFVFMYMCMCVLLYYKRKVCCTLAFNNLSKPGAEHSLPELVNLCANGPLSVTHLLRHFYMTFGNALDQSGSFCFHSCNWLVSMLFHKNVHTYGCTQVEPRECFLDRENV